LDEVRTFMVHAKEQERESTVHLLVKHKGQLKPAASALGIAEATLWHRIERHGLRDFVQSLRPRTPSPEQERALILDALRRHNGQMRKVYEELGMSRNTLLARIQKYDLFAQAEGLREEANLIGPRTHLPAGRDQTERRAKLVALLESCDWNVTRAMQLAGVSNGTFYTLMRKLGVERPKEAPQDRMHRLVDGLRLSHGNMEKTARHMGLSASTVLKWCREFDIDPRDYR
jgi:transcriptional regulator of acetoin/glycerol metabolism